MKRFFLVATCVAVGALGTYLGQSFLQGQAPVGAAIPRENWSYRDVVKKVLPAVVSIESQAKGGGRIRRGADDMQFRPFGGAPIFPNQRGQDDDPSQVGFGSGFLISPKGVIVTNNHVVDGADQVVVQLRSGKKFVSSDIKTDAKTDLAVIVVDAREALPYLEFGDSSAMEIGDRVLAVGAPFGLTGTVTHGIISSKARAIKLNMYEDFLQTDAAINPGNSGGPLVDLEGRVIGVNSAIKSRSGGFQGVGLAISSNLAKAIIDQLVKTGVVRRGYLGVGIRDVDEERAAALKLTEASGVQITRVDPDTPGAKGGLESGDVIMRLGNRKITDSRDLQTAVAGSPVGKSVDVEIIREGKRQTLKVVIEEQPKDFGTARRPASPRSGLEIEKIGVTITDLTIEYAEALGYPDTVKGALIVRVERGGLAGLAGIRSGMVILSVEGKPVNSAKAAAALLEAGSTARGITLQVRGPKTAVQTVTLKDE